MQKRIKLRFLDVLFVLLCLAGAGYSGYKFYEELYRTLEKQNEEPIANIIIKENIAQRKFEDGKIWDRLKTEAKIYNGDTIHTSAKSLAAVQFIDENSIELGANTLIRVYLKVDDEEDGSVINLENGSVTINSFNSVIKIKSKDSIIVIDKNSTLNANYEEGVGLKVYLKEGSAKLQKEDGSIGEKEIQQGVVVTYNDSGDVLSTVPPELIEEIEDLYSEPPVLIAPVPEYKVQYRTKIPTIRFIWSQLNLANSYQLEIADNTEMKNPVFSQRVQQTSRIINELPEGKWYWRVIPYYQLTKSFGTASEVQSLVINKTPELEKPVLLMPKNNGLTSTRLPLSNGGYVYKKVVLSWKDNPEAVKYNVKVWTGSSSNCIVEASTTKNYYEIDTTKVDLKNGKWNWSVGLTDSEGNYKESNVRAFIAIDDEIVQRTIFPPDGYRLSEGRTADVRYSWKSNIPSDTIFELSKDSNFKNILFKQVTTSNSASGRTLSPGTYYWRIRSEIEGVELKTSPKTLIVEPPMEAPALLNPVSGSKAVVRPDRPFDIKWAPVDGADYYQIKVYPLGNPDNVLFEKNYLETTSVRMNFASWKEQSYGISLQAFREETVLASRATSFLGKYNFNLIKIKPIEIITPENGIVIDGVEAVKNPGVFEWNYVGKPARCEIVVYKGDVAPENEFLRIQNPETVTQMPAFYSGIYNWTVLGYTADNYDISVGKYYGFAVTPIEKMPKPVVIIPKNRTTFDKEYFKVNRTIMFQWNPVEKADRYVLRILNPENELVVEKILKKDVTSYEFTELEKLSVGNFTWTLEAQTMWGNVVFQNGDESVQTFRVSLPSIKTPTATDEGVRYGR